MMIRILTIMAILGSTGGFRSAQADQTNLVPERCQHEQCIPCCIAASNRDSKDGYGYQQADTPAPVPSNEATKANQ